MELPIEAVAEPILDMPATIRGNFDEMLVLAGVDYMIIRHLIDEALAEIERVWLLSAACGKASAERQHDSACDATAEPENSCGKRSRDCPAMAALMQAASATRSRDGTFAGEETIAACVAQQRGSLAEHFDPLRGARIGCQQGLYFWRLVGIEFAVDIGDK